MFVSIHIPKTAGTTIGYILDYGSRRRIYYDYSEIYDSNELRKDIALIANHKELFEKKFDIIHGHFRYGKYIELFPCAKYLTCLREPIARTLSQYYHVIQEANHEFWQYQKIVSGEMNILDFARLPNIVEAQQLFCKGRELEDYDFIFISEKLVESIYKFQIKFGFERNDPYMMLEGNDSLPNTNPKTARKSKIPEKLKVTEKQKKELRNILKSEIEYYERAVKINAGY